MDEDWLTVTELAARLGRPPSTVKYWRDTHRDVLEARTNERGHPTYRLAVFARIDALMHGRPRASRSDIRRALAELRASDAEARPAPTFEEIVIARLDRLTLAVERIADRLDPPPEE